MTVGRGAGKSSPQPDGNHAVSHAQKISPYSINQLPLRKSPKGWKPAKIGGMDGGILDSIAREAAWLLGFRFRLRHQIFCVLPASSISDQR
jgi:hypothetical protein